MKVARWWVLVALCAVSCILVGSCADDDDDDARR